MQFNTPSLPPGWERKKKRLGAENKKMALLMGTFFIFKGILNLNVYDKFKMQT